MSHLNKIYVVCKIQLFSSQALKEVNLDRSHKMQSRLYDVFENLYSRTSMARTPLGP